MRISIAVFCISSQSEAKLFSVLTHSSIKGAEHAKKNHPYYRRGR
jgi:hypothetical protein